MSEGGQWKYTKLGHCENGCRLLNQEITGGANHHEEKPDPYVIRAKERAKSKIKNKMIGLNSIQ